MMKTLKIFLLISISALCGYFIYPLVNPSSYSPSPELISFFKKFLENEARDYAAASNAEEKLRAADKMYEKMMVLFLANLGLKGRMNSEVDWNIHLTIAEEDAAKSLPPVRPADKPPGEQKKEETIAQKIANDRLDLKSYLGFKNFTVLPSNDARILKLKGRFVGNYKSVRPTRTGEDDKATLTVNMDKDNKLTTLLIADSYDNVSYEATTETASAFRSIPGDENLLWLNLDDGESMVLDLSSFPNITGKKLRLNFKDGEVQFKKMM